MKHFLSLFAVLFYFTINVYSQNNQIVDYKKIKHENNFSNTQKLDCFLLLIEQNRYIDSISTKNIVYEALLWSKTINDKAVKSEIHSAFCFLTKTSIHYFKNSKLDYFHSKEALKLAKESNDNKALSYAYLAKGNIEIAEDKLDIAIRSFLQAENFALKTNNYHLQSIAYLYLTSLYRKIGDFDNEFITAKKALEKAKLSKNKNADIAAAYMALANAYSISYTDGMYDDEKTKEKTNFDLAIDSFQKCATFSKMPDVYRKNNISESYYGVAAIYFWKDQIKNREIISKYLDLTEQFLREYSNPKFYCSTKIFRVQYLIKDGKLTEAKKILEELDKLYDTFSSDIKIVNIFSYSNAIVYRDLGDFKESVSWYNDVIVTYQMLYNTNRNIAVKKAEAKYINKTKILELAQAQKDIKYQRNQKIWGFTIAVITVIGMFFMYRFYKSRQSEQVIRQQLLRKQKEEAELYAKLQAQEAKQIAVEKQIEQQQKEQFQKQFMASILQMERKNEILTNLKTTINEIELVQKNPEIKKVNKIIDHGFTLDDDFENFKMNFENVYPSFFNQLQQKASGELSQLDLKYCAYINMGLTNKEIANLLNIEPASVRMTRYRLKQKLALEKEDDLTEFIRVLN